MPRGIEPRFICQQDGLSQLEQNFLDDLSYRVVNEQQRSTVIFPITSVAYSFLHSSMLTAKNRSIPTAQLYTDKTSLFHENASLLEQFSTEYRIHWPSDNDHNNFRQRLLSLYPDVFELVGGQSVALKITGDRLVDAALQMKLIMYRNTCLHLFAQPAYVLLMCQATSQVTKKEGHASSQRHPFISFHSSPSSVTNKYESTTTFSLICLPTNSSTIDFLSME